eukprot:2091535-Amphidinium_carterae.2
MPPHTQQMGKLPPNIFLSAPYPNCTCLTLCHIGVLLGLGRAGILCSDGGSYNSSHGLPPND